MLVKFWLVVLLKLCVGLGPNGDADEVWNTNCISEQMIRRMN